MARAKRTCVVYVRVTPDVHDCLVAEAEANAATISEVLTRVLQERYGIAWVVPRG